MSSLKAVEQFISLKNKERRTGRAAVPLSTDQECSLSSFHLNHAFISDMVRDGKAKEVIDCLVQESNENECYSWHEGVSFI